MSASSTACGSRTALFRSLDDRREPAPGSRRPSRLGRPGCAPPADSLPLTSSSSSRTTEVFTGAANSRSPCAPRSPARVVSSRSATPVSSPPRLRRPREVRPTWRSSPSRPRCRRCRGAVWGGRSAGAVVVTRVRRGREKIGAAMQENVSPRRGVTECGSWVRTHSESWPQRPDSMPPTPASISGPAALPSPRSQVRWGSPSPLRRNGEKGGHLVVRVDGEQGGRQRQRPAASVGRRRRHRGRAALPRIVQRPRAFRRVLDGRPAQAGRWG